VSNGRSRLAGAAAVYLGANVLNAAIPFLLLPVLTRVLTPADYGTVAMFALVTTVLGAFTGLSVQGAVAVRYFQLSREDFAEFVATCAGVLVASTAAVACLVAVAGAPLETFTGVPRDWLLVAVLVSGLQFVSNIRLSLLQVQGEARKYGVFQVGQSLLNGVASLVLVLVVHMAWEGRALGQAIAVMLFGGIAAWWLKLDGMLRFPRRWRHHLGDALKFGVPLIPHVLGGLLVVAVDRFVITRELGLAEAGIYMVALQLGQGLGLVTEAFNRAYAPWLMHRLAAPDRALRLLVVRGTYLYFAIVMALAAIVGLAAPLILDLLVGDAFREAAGIVIYIALGFAFGGCYYMVTNYLFYESKTAPLSAITIGCGLANVPLTYLLVRHNGLAGAAQAFMLTQAASFLLTWWLANKYHPMPWLSALRTAGAENPT
jgi:O-antigen/teichoic acid export membrane protein